MQERLPGIVERIAFDSGANVKAGEVLAHTFPEAFAAYWVRAVTERDTTATVLFDYR